LRVGGWRISARSRRSVRWLRTRRSVTWRHWRIRWWRSWCTVRSSDLAWRRWWIVALTSGGVRSRRGWSWLVTARGSVHRLRRDWSTWRGAVNVRTRVRSCWLRVSGWWPTSKIKRSLWLSRKSCWRLGRMSSLTVWGLPWMRWWCRVGSWMRSCWRLAWKRSLSWLRTLTGGSGRRRCTLRRWHWGVWGRSG